MVAQVAGEDAVTVGQPFAIKCQFCEEPKRPCRMTIGGPLPYSRNASEIAMPKFLVLFDEICPSVPFKLAYVGQEVDIRA